MKPLKGSTIEHAFFLNWKTSNIHLIYPFELYKLQMKVYDPITHTLIKTVGFTVKEWREVERI